VASEKKISKLTKEERTRRVALLCIHFVRNLAYYRTGWKGRDVNKDPEFWKTVNGNSIDICVLEWCKLFVWENGEPGKHHWRKVIEKEPEFFNSLLSNLDISKSDFDNYARNEVKDYRYTFVAHLDNEKNMYPPKLDIAYKSVCFLYSQIYEYLKFDPKFPLNMEGYYDLCIKEASVIYSQITGQHLTLTTNN